MITFKCETPDMFFHETLELFKAHNEEINLFGQELHIDEDYYKSEWVKCFIARDGGDVVGYASFEIHPMLHHKETHATMTTLYVKPEKRKEGLGQAILDFSEKILKSNNISHVHIGVPKINDWSKMLDGKGYSELETIYVKEL